MNKYSIEIKRLMDQAATEGEATSKQVVKEVSRIVGVHAAQQLKSSKEVPTAIKEIIENTSQGINAGLLLYHGQHGVMDIRMMQVTR
ncbi:hypothetical protein [Paenibacillus sp. GXUN7292]|uniref:hypothetical protein n=1 Tax=Paenibacillus sp. GXUN7292 TaxID=3422499 RepID=UPI003D7DADCA